jgi:hypothetical protein
MVARLDEILTFEQENGPDVELVVFGDEFYARCETRDSYPVVYDTDPGLSCTHLLRPGQETRPKTADLAISTSTMSHLENGKK